MLVALVGRGYRAPAEDTGADGRATASIADTV